MKLKDVFRKGRIWRWLLILLAAAVLLPVIGFLGTESRHNAHVWLRVPKPWDKPREQWGEYRDAQVAHILSDLVLDAALRKPEIAELGILKNKKDKKTWLAKNLEVGYLGGSEILQIAMTEVSGKNISDAMRIVLAVRKAYMETAVDWEEDARLRAALEDEYKDMEELITAKKFEIEYLRKQRGKLTSPEMAELVSELRDMQRMYDEMEWQLAHGDTRHAQEINEPDDSTLFGRPRRGIRGFGK